MCGIFGYIGTENAVKTCIEGLKQLAYRGYDSSGIAGIRKGQLVSIKAEGKIVNLEKKIQLKDLELAPIIGHTRWATHGIASENNAHPHIDSKETLAVVHNGIIDNFDSLRTFLKQKNISFRSETDTEVISQLIAYHYEGNLTVALNKTLSLLKGSFAIAIIHKDFPNQIIAASRESPLAIGYNHTKKERLISSDPNAFLGRNLNVFYLRNDEIAVINRQKIEVLDAHLSPIIKKTEKFNSTLTFPTKEGYEHFMLKEIFEQPNTIQKAMLGHYSENFGTAIFDNLNFSNQELMATRHILIIACGTSWHAGSIGASMLEDMARISTQAEIASELRFKNPIISDNTLVIAISQSGETADTIAAVREAKAKGAKILGIVNAQNTTLTRESDSCLFLKAGPEISVCSTKAFTSQITVLALFALYMARLRHMSKEDGKAFLDELKKIPDVVTEVLQRHEQIQSLAKKYSTFHDFFFLGRRYMHTTSLEAALKLKEISYLNANGYPAGEIKHGPIALISPKLPVIAFCANHQTYDKILGNLMEVKSRGAPILAFAPYGAHEVQEIADDVFWLPPTIDELATYPSSIAAQLLAYYIAKEKGTEIDQPRNLAKSVTVQ
ncbi:MAG: glutamine--fructose-6-phosphate transaminase (isomerizing) [Parachlamydiales bacterium]|nr:glutamine--fructose-6-phosphate transaminase (isomerizing) [Parachlamydiales bacterium]